MPVAALRAALALLTAVAVVATVQVAVSRRQTEAPATAYVVLEPYLSAHASPPTALAPTRQAQRVATAAEVQPNDPLWQVSWSLAKSGAPAAWRRTTGSPEVIVAVVDTGVDPHHPDLQGALVAGWDAVNDDADPADDHGHGTAVAGIVAARSNNGIGVTGACWRCGLMPVKVIAADGVGSAADIAQGIGWAAEHGADVINLSFVMSGPDGRVAAAIDRARSQGALVVAAAGNTGGRARTFPASHPGVLSVTATDPSDNLYAWATHGEWVSMAAPGCSQSTVLGGAYGEFCGTSAATALTSGAAALVRSAAGDAGSDLVYSTLAANAVRVGAFVASGRIDVARSLERSWRARGASSAPAALRMPLD